MPIEVIETARIKYSATTKQFHRQNQQEPNMISYNLKLQIVIRTPWRNGSASDSRSEGCVFESRRGQINFLIIRYNVDKIIFLQLKRFS